MRRLIYASLILAVVSSCSSKSDDKMENLKKEIELTLSETKGVFGVAFKNLSTGDTLFINAKEIFHAASTMKTPVMIELYRQAGEGAFSLEDSLMVKNEFSSIVDGSPYTMDITDDSEPGLYEQIGKRLPIRDLIFPMITRSSNLATNILIEKVGAKNVTNRMRSLGAMDIQVLRGVEDIKAFDKGLSNTTTAMDLAIIMESIANFSAADEESCKEMLDVLFQQRFNEIIPARLPSGVEVAHKTGSITGVQHDSGIVFLPGGPKYVLK